MLPCSQQVNLTWARDPIGKPEIGQRSASKKHVISISCKLKPAIWPRDTGQRIPCFKSCQLIVAWMSNIKEVHTKRRLYVSVNLFCRNNDCMADTTWKTFRDTNMTMIDYQPLFGKGARAPPPNISGRNVDQTRESGGNRAYNMTRTDIAGSQQWTAVSLLLEIVSTV